MIEPVGRVVVVEDEAAVREAVVAALRHEGFVARGYGDAIDPGAILGFAPDLAVILDIRLPSGERGLPSRDVCAIAVRCPSSS